jgi:hypothetical protein
MQAAGSEAAFGSVADRFDVVAVRIDDEADADAPWAQSIVVM